MNHSLTIVLVDDHILLRKGLSDLIKKFGYRVLFEADNGEDFIQKLSPENKPDLILLDINMPRKSGYEVALWLKKTYPDVKILALSMYDDDESIVKMLKSGAHGYILKDSEPDELKQALEELSVKGFYYSETVTRRILNTIGDNNSYAARAINNLSEREVEFLKLAATELTYKEMADKMNLSPRTIDGYRDALFEKLSIKNRVGLVLFAIKNGIVKV